MIKSQIKINNVYYENADTGELGIYPLSETNERMTIGDAEKQLLIKNVPFTSVLKVRVSYEEIELPVEIYEKYKK